MSKQINSVIHDQQGLNTDGFSVENQYLKFNAVDGDYGLFYQIDTKGGQWSFTDVNQITELLSSFIKISEGLR